ncbi:MAG: TonB-dependent receptor [Verrucomicrobiota bacterium]|nr:TonB-dependent receptor [Verrucomicrobiota bacterium]
MKRPSTTSKTLALPALFFAIAVLTVRAQMPEPSPSATPAKMSSIVVIGQPIPGATVVVPTPELRAAATDAASLLSQVPGAAVVRNGPLTAIVQLRGLSDDRVRVLVDGMSITPACPFHMDPPLHYIAPSALHSLTVVPGISPVSLGGDNIGGVVLAEPKPARFSPNEQTLFSGALGSFYRSSNDGVGANGGFTLANQNWSGNYHGSWEMADDLRIPDGRVKDSGFDEFQEHEGRIAGRLLNGVFEAYGGVSRTRNAGTPALPMDMLEDDSWHAGLRQTSALGFGELEARFGFHSIDHLMNNFSLRPLPPGAAPLIAPTHSDDWSGSVGLTIPRDKDVFRTGLDFHLSFFDALLMNAASGAEQNNINNATRNRIGTYFEWQKEWNDQWTTLAGVRSDTVWSNTNDIEKFFPPASADAAAFNARSHDLTDVDIDAMISVRFTPDEHSTYDLAFARKNRAPSILERYIYTPLAASSGASDGRTYLGNLELDPEVSHQIALTGDWHGEGWELKVTPFYNFVSDYIQGTAINRLVNGLPVLQYQNLDRADLYGVDAEAHYDLTKEFTLRGQLSYVRGVDRDNDDSLYRIQPLHGTVSLSHHWSDWHSAVELAWATGQDDVSAFNNEPTSDGYAVLNLRTGYTFHEHLHVDLTLQNLFDENYADHLAGINRVLGSDVPVGQRIPSAGRALAISVSYEF